MNAAPAVATKSRMSLGSIKNSRRQAPDRILLVGTEGIGKSTFASDAPDPIFIAAEDGVRHLDVKMFPQPETIEDVRDALRELRTGEHGFKTIVIDTLDWLEPIIWKSLCKKNGWDSIEAPGYGKGYVAALDSWREVLSDLDRLRADRGMETILLAHASIKPFANPTGADFNRYECKLHRQAAALVREWCDVNLFAVHEEFVQKDKAGRDLKKAVSTGLRLIKTERTAAWDAKNRYGLPPELPLSYADYVASRERGIPADAETLLAEAAALIERIPPADATKARVYIDSVRDNPGKLARAINRLRTLVVEQPAEEQKGEN